MRSRPYAALLRTSSDLQREAETIKTQEQEMRIWCQRQGIDPDEDVYWFRDDGVSGDVPIWDRPEGARLREYIEEGRITKGVLAYHISRVNRGDLLSYFELDLLCKDYRLALRTMADGVDTSTAAGRLVGSIGAILADKAKDEVVEQMQAGKRRKAREGRWQGKAPFGFRRNSDGSLAQDAEQVAIILEMVRLLLEERSTDAAIGREMTMRGIPSPGRGAAWYHSAVARVLTNPALVGRATYNRSRTIRKRGKIVGYAPREEEEHIVIPCPPIIDEATWTQVLQSLESNGARYTKDGSISAHFFLGVVVCGVCGKRFHLQTTKQKHAGPPYRCYRHNWHKLEYRECPGYGSIARDAVEVPVWERVLKAIEDPDGWHDELVRQADNGGQEPREMEAASRAVRAAESALSKLEDAYFVRGTITTDRYDAMASKLNLQLSEARANLRRAEERARNQEAQHKRAAGLMTYAQEIAQQVKEVARAATIEQKRDICARLIRRIVVLPADDGWELIIDWNA